MLLASANPSAGTAQGVKPDPFAAPSHTISNHRRVSFSTAPPLDPANASLGGIGAGKTTGTAHNPGGLNHGIPGKIKSETGPGAGGRQGKFMRKMYKSHSFHQGMLEADVGALTASGGGNTMDIIAENHPVEDEQDPNNEEWDKFSDASSLASYANPSEYNSHSRSQSRRGSEFGGVGVGGVSRKGSVFSQGRGQWDPSNDGRRNSQAIGGNASSTPSQEVNANRRNYLQRGSVASGVGGTILRTNMNRVVRQHSQNNVGGGNNNSVTSGALPQISSASAKLYGGGNMNSANNTMNNDGDPLLANPETASIATGAGPGPAVAINVGSVSTSASLESKVGQNDDHAPVNHFASNRSSVGSSRSLAGGPGGPGQQNSQQGQNTNAFKHRMSLASLRSVNTSHTTASTAQQLMAVEAMRSDKRSGGNINNGAGNNHGGGGGGPNGSTNGGSNGNSNNPVGSGGSNGNSNAGRDKHSNSRYSGRDSAILNLGSGGRRVSTFEKLFGKPDIHESVPSIWGRVLKNKSRFFGFDGKDGGQRDAVKEIVQNHTMSTLDSSMSTMTLTENDESDHHDHDEIE